MFGRQPAPVRITLRLQLRLLRADDVLMLLFFSLWPSSQMMRPNSTFCTCNQENAIKKKQERCCRVKGRTLEGEGDAPAPGSAGAFHS